MISRIPIYQHLKTQIVESHRLMKENNCKKNQKYGSFEKSKLKLVVCCFERHLVRWNNKVLYCKELSLVEGWPKSVHLNTVDSGMNSRSLYKIWIIVWISKHGIWQLVLTYLKIMQNASQCACFGLIWIPASYERTTLSFKAQVIFDGFKFLIKLQMGVIVNLKR